MMNEFELEDFHRNIDDVELLADLKRVSKALGKSPTFREYNQHGKFSSSTINTRFGSWLVALDKCGFSKTINRNISNEKLFENLVSVWTALGRQPKSRDLASQNSEYSWSTYAGRFGGWRNGLKEFAKWANEENLVPSSRDISPSVAARRTTRNVNWRLRALVLMRDEAKCRLCGATPRDGAKLEVDHILPWSKGGETELENLQILCMRCNSGKSDII